MLKTQLFTPERHGYHLIELKKIIKGAILPKDHLGGGGAHNPCHLSKYKGKNIYFMRFLTHFMCDFYQLLLFFDN